MDCDYAMDDALNGEVIDLIWRCVGESVFDSAVDAVSYLLLDLISGSVEQIIYDAFSNMIIEVSNLLWVTVKEYGWD